MIMPFWDDASAVEANKKVLIVNIDTLVGKTDIPPGATYKQMGRKAVLMGVSDVIAKGARPVGLLASWGVPRKFTLKEIEEIVQGLNMASEEFEAYVLGGDLNESDDLFISVVAFGWIDKSKIVTRRGAKPGDYLVSTGTFGLTGVGFKILLHNYRAPQKIKEKALNSVYFPQIKWKEYLRLTERKLVTASIDCSDGLAVSLHQLSRLSQVGFCITNIPIAKEALEFSEKHGLDPYDLALYEGGEEFHIVFTVKPNELKKATSIFEENGSKLYVLGKATSRKEVFLDTEDKKEVIEEKGWEHLRITRLT